MNFPAKKKRRAPRNHSYYTLEVYRKLGYTVATVERWIAPIKQRKDAFGFIDHIAIKPGHPIIAIQSTGDRQGNRTEDRFKKITGRALEAATDEKELKRLIEMMTNARTWLQTGCACPNCGTFVPAAVIDLCVWRLLKAKRGGKREKWDPQITGITLDDFGPEAPTPPTNGHPAHASGPASTSIEESDA